MNNKSINWAYCPCCGKNKGITKKEQEDLLENEIRGTLKFAKKLLEGD